MKVYIVYHQNNANSLSPDFCSVMAALSNVQEANGLAQAHGAKVDTISFNFETQAPILMENKILQHTSHTLN